MRKNTKKTQQVEFLEYTLVGSTQIRQYGYKDVWILTFQKEPRQVQEKEIENQCCDLCGNNHMVQPGYSWRGDKEKKTTGGWNLKR